jgi:Flp pilus assembly protein TadG
MRRNHARSGVAATEFAVILPLIVILGVVPLELCNLIQLKQSVAVAAYEAAKVATHPDGDTAKATAVYQRVISERGIKGASIDVVPDPLMAANGEEVAVTVSASFQDNSFFRVWFIDCQPNSTVIMSKE